MLTFRIGIVALVLAVWWSPQAPAGGRPDDCDRRGKTVVANDRARIYTIDAGSIVAYGCTHGRKPRDLGVVGRSSGASAFALAGTFAAYVVRGAGCGRGECLGDLIEVVNLRTGRVATYGGSSFVIRSGRSVAIVRRERFRNLVIAVENGVERVLDEGAIDVDSLALTGSRIYWLKDGAPQTALLR